MERYVIGAAAVLLGVVMVAFNRRIGQYQVSSQGRLWARLGLRVAPRFAGVSRMLIVLWGLASMILGALMLTGIMPM